MTDDASREGGAFLDFLPTHVTGSPEGRKQAEAFLRAQVEAKLPDIVDRFGELPPIMVRVGPHVDLLSEARALYVHGYFYSCVAQCGITSERILKDLMSSSLRLVTPKGAHHLPEGALEHLDWFEQSRIARFLAACELISKDVRKAALDLCELRNRYSHGSGKKPKDDALKAIGLLHAVVEGTVSLFKHVLPKEEK